ncbi:4Fe-4S dicluster domain-containing protein [Desulfococcaceae bacterium HSG8]|nr:4Fe-4S dicluster domain-containing protein [Desulfococcaceae bacterium HSG8]
MSYLIGHFDKCTGCSICQLACSERTHGGFNPRFGNLDIRMSDDALVHHPFVCHQCENAFCEKVCPASAISRDGESGALVVDREVCVGCGTCADACPINMIRVVGKKAYKCDLCGGEPECVAVCPAGAIELIVKTVNAEVMP